MPIDFERLLGTAIRVGAKYYLNKLVSRKEQAKPRQTATATVRAPGMRQVLPLGDRFGDYLLGEKLVPGYQFFEQDLNDGLDQWRAYCFSEGACNTITRVYINGVNAPFTRQGNRLVFTGDFADRITVYQNFAANGSQGAEIRAACDQFEASYQGQLVSWASVHINQPNWGEDDEERFWEQPPDLMFVVRGMLTTWPGQTTPRWTNNVFALRYWLETVKAGIAADRIDVPAFQTAYNIAEQPAAFSLPGNLAGYTRTFTRRYQLNEVLNITADTNLDDIRELFDFCCAGFVAESNKKLYFNAGADRTVVHNLTERDIVSIIERKDQPSWSDQINGVTMTLDQSIDHDYLEYDMPMVTDQPAKGLDNNRTGTVNSGRIGGVNSPVLAAWLATIALRNIRSTQQIVLNLFSGPEDGPDPFAYFGLKTGDWVTLTIPRYSFDQKLFSVFSVEPLVADGTVNVVLEEQTLGNHALTFDFPPIKSRLTPTDFGLVPTLTGLSLDEIAGLQEDGTVLIRHEATWDPRSYRTEIQQRLQGTTNATPQSIETGHTLSFEPVRAGATYEYRGRHFSAEGIYGEWSAWVADKVDGDLDPPADPTGVTFMAIPEGYRVHWNTPPVVDNDYTRARIYETTDLTASFDERFFIEETDSTFIQRTGFTEVTMVKIWVQLIDASRNTSNAVAVTGSTGKVAAMNVPLSPNLDVDDDGNINLIPSILDLIFGDRGGDALVAPTLRITDLTRVNENQLALLLATVTGGNYDTIEFRWEIISGGGTLAPVTE